MSMFNKIKKKNKTKHWNIFPSTKVSATQENTSGFNHKQVFCFSVTLHSSIRIFLHSLNQSHTLCSWGGYKENFKLENPTTAPTTTIKKSNFPICFIYVTHAFRQETYLQASGGPFVEEHNPKQNASANLKWDGKPADPE